MPRIVRDRSFRRSTQKLPIAKGERGGVETMTFGLTLTTIAISTHDGCAVDACASE